MSPGADAVGRRDPRLPIYDRPVSERAETLRESYRAFNARDIDAALTLMSPRVNWPNAWEGGRVVGHDAVRDYWTRQWAEIDPHVEPLRIEERDDGTVAVEVGQVVRALDGTILSEGRVRHVFAFEGDLVSRMDVEELDGTD
jgi:ketosteroid isomerase-like protein